MSWASTVNDSAKTGTSDNTLADTQAAIDYVAAKAQDGWVVTVGGVGATCNFATELLVNVPYNFTMQGASPTSRTTINSAATNYGIGISCTSGKLVTLKNFNFPDYASTNAMVFISGTGTDAFRITNCTVDASNHGAAKWFCYVNAPAAGVTTEGPYGLFDHLTCTSTGAFAGIFVRAGDAVASWDRPMSWGTNKTVCVEDCTVTCDVLAAGVPFVDNDDGGRYLVRHCIMQNASCRNHGADTAGPLNSALQMEVLHNTITITDGQALSSAFGCRGGSAVINDNTLLTTGTGSITTLLRTQYHRAAPFGDGQGGVTQDRWFNALNTTIAAGSNGASLPQATINVASTASLGVDFASGASLPIKVTTAAGVQDVIATGKTATSFTGCTGGTGAMSTGGEVTKTSDYVGTMQPGSGHVGSAGGDPRNPSKFWGIVGIYAWGNNLGSATPISDDSYSFLVLNDGYFPSAMPGYVELVYPHPLQSGSDTTAPTLVSCSINAAGNTLALVFSESVTGVVAADYHLSGHTLLNPSGSGSNWTFTIGPKISQGESVTLSYGSQTRDAKGNVMAPFTGVSVKNGSTRKPRKPKRK